MKLWIVLIAVAQLLSAQTYPGPPVQRAVGNLYCGSRMLDATHIQSWCFRKVWAADGTPLPWRLVDNRWSEVEISPADTALVTGYIKGGDQMMLLDSHLANGPVKYQVTSTPGAYAEGTLAAVPTQTPVVGDVCDANPSSFWCCAAGVPVPTMNFIAESIRACATPSCPMPPACPLLNYPFYALSFQAQWKSSCAP